MKETFWWNELLVATSGNVNGFLKLEIIQIESYEW